MLFVAQLCYCLLYVWDCFFHHVLEEALVVVGYFFWGFGFYPGYTLVQQAKVFFVAVEAVCAVGVAAYWQGQGIGYFFLQHYKGEGIHESCFYPVVGAH